jgi:glycosyltransferase involved in cell wall biosynthesis
MIVKDESHIIHECLECTLPLIDTYCIVDTGSTDNTIDIIKKFYESRGIPGEVHSRPWKNFGANRSEALKLCDGKMDYILVIDADDLITFPKNGRELLNQYMATSPSSMSIRIHRGILRYTRTQIFKANDGWRYCGVLHEYPTNDKPQNCIELPHEFWMDGRTIGGRSKSADKFLKDAETLEKGLLDEPQNERYMFYLAQSYRDSGNVEKAIEWYTKRFEFGGWFEERYVSGLNLVKLTHSKEWAWKAHEINRHRIECLFSYMAHCRAKNMWSQELYAMAKYATTIPMPNQKLFIEPDVYEWKVWDEFSIIAYYTGHHAESAAACEMLLKNPNLPAHHYSRVVTNLSYTTNAKPRPSLEPRLAE